MGRVSLFVLSLAILCAIQLKLHVCEDALTRKLQQRIRGDLLIFLQIIQFILNPNHIKVAWIYPYHLRA